MSSLFLRVQVSSLLCGLLLPQLWLHFAHHARLQPRKVLNRWVIVVHQLHRRVLRHSVRHYMHGVPERSVFGCRLVQLHYLQVGPRLQ